MGRPLGPAVCGAVAAEAVVEGWASLRGGSAMAESGARPRLAEGLLLRLDGRSDPDPVREDDGGDWAGDFLGPAGFALPVGRLCCKTVNGMR